MNEIIPVQSLSLPNGLLYFMDVVYDDKKKSRRDRKKSMKLFKIKYLNTKGIAKTRSIKASSEASAMSKIKDMETHYYTIVEDLDETEVPKKTKDKELEEKWKPIIDKIGGGFSDEKKSWLTKYAMYHAEAITEKAKYTSYDSYDTGINGLNLNLGGYNTTDSDMYSYDDTSEQGQ